MKGKEDWEPSAYHAARDLVRGMCSVGLMVRVALLLCSMSYMTEWIKSGRRSCVWVKGRKLRLQG